MQIINKIQTKIFRSLSITITSILILMPVFGQEIEDYCGVQQSVDEWSGREVERPQLSGPEETIENDHFIIHFTFDGVDATTQEWAESALVYAEESYQTYSNLGWMLPPPDGGIGGDDRYDIYITNYSGGTCVAENPYTDPFVQGSTSFI